MFCENLRRIRQEKGMTQQELADRILICNQSISKWETGTVSPQVKWLYAIADVLEVNPKDLI